jgi:prolipoprotein diacylglyceryl transferase
VGRRGGGVVNPLAFLPLAYLPPPPTEGWKIGPVFIHIYGLCIAIGILAAVSLARRRWQATGRDPAELEVPMFWGVVAGFIGARIAFVSTNLHQFSGDNWWRVVAIWEGGIALYGGLTLGILVGLLVAKRRGLPVLAALDAAIVGIPLAQAFGRWGNYFNQELYGTPTTLPWGLRLDKELPDGSRLTGVVHPTFLYESLYNLLVVVILLRISATRRLRTGSLILIYGILYGTGRFLLELLRTDTTFRLFGLSRNAYVSIAVVLGSAILLLLRERRAAGAAGGGAAGGGEDGTPGDGDAGAPVPAAPAPTPAGAATAATAEEATGEGQAASRPSSA